MQDMSGREFKGPIPREKEKGTIRTMNPTETFSIYFTFKDGSQDSLTFTNKEERDHVLYDLVEHLRLVGSMFIGGEDSFKKYFIARSSEIQTIVSVDPQPKKEEVDNED